MEPTTTSAAYTEVRRKDWLNDTDGTVRTRLQILVHIPEGENWRTVLLRYGNSLLPSEVDEVETKALKRIRRKYGITTASVNGKIRQLSPAASGPRESKWGIDPSLDKAEKRKLRRLARAEAAKAQS